MDGHTAGHRCGLAADVFIHLHRHVAWKVGLWLRGGSFAFVRCGRNTPVLARQYVCARRWGPSRYCYTQPIEYCGVQSRLRSWPLYWPSSAWRNRALPQCRPAFYILVSPYRRIFAGSIFAFTKSRSSSCPQSRACVFLLFQPDDARDRRYCAQPAHGACACYAGSRDRPAIPCNLACACSHESDADTRRIAGALVNHPAIKAVAPSRLEQNYLGYDRSQPGCVRILFRQAFGQYTDQICVKLRECLTRLTVLRLRGLALQRGR